MDVPDYPCPPSLKSYPDSLALIDLVIAAHEETTFDESELADWLCANGIAVQRSSNDWLVERTAIEQVLGVATDLPYYNHAWNTFSLLIEMAMDEWIHFSIEDGLGKFSYHPSKARPHLELVHSLD